MELLLNLDEFGRSAIERFARNRAGSQSAAVRTASLYYLADCRGERSTWQVPRFAKSRRDHPDRPGGHGLVVDLDEDTWQAVTVEAERQNVSPETLVTHAVVYFLADLDSGRLGDRLDDALNEI
jgi:hypothetical protein